MSFTTNTVVSDGVTTQYPVSFTNGIYDRTYVKVYVEDDVDGGGNQLERSFTWINDGLIELDVAAPSGKKVTIRRELNRSEPDVDYVDGAILDEQNLNQSMDQLIGLIQEIFDGVGIESFSRDLDMNGFRLTNLGVGSADTDSVTLAQVQDIIANLSDGTVFIKEESQTGAQVVTDVTTFTTVTFTPGLRNLLVFLNGVKQKVGRDYLELTGNRIQWIADVTNTDDIDAIVNLTTTSVSNTDASLVDYTPTGGSPSTVDTYLDNRHITYMSDSGMLGDGITDESVSFLAAIAATPVNGVLKAQPGKTYYFGTVAGDTTVATITKNITIDWQGSKIVVDGDNTATWTGSGFVKFQDTNGSMKNFIFDDTTFDIVNGPSRGVAPIQVRSETTSSTGFTFSNYHVIKGNSLLQVTSSDPQTYRASSIALEGAITADDIYYGLNLDGADNVVGAYSCNRSIRLVFAKQIKAVKLKGYCETGRPTSGSVNISNDSKYPTAFTEDSEFDMSFGEVNGPLLFNLNNVGGAAGDDGKGTIRDIKIKFRAKVIGANLIGNTPVIFRDYDTSGASVVGATGTMDGITCDIELPTDTANPIRNICDSPNFGTLVLNPANFTAVNWELGSFVLDKGYNKIFKSQKGSFATAIRIPLGFLYPDLANQVVAIRLHIATREDTSGLGQKSAITVVDLLGDISSGGITTVRQQSTATQSTTGGVSPTFTVTNVTGVGIDIIVNGYANGANNIVSVTAENLE